jgi:hypothetical protein
MIGLNKYLVAYRQSATYFAKMTDRAVLTDVADKNDIVLSESAEFR